jgi:hypothetical protein
MYEPMPVVVERFRQLRLPDVTRMHCFHILPAGGKVIVKEHAVRHEDEKTDKQSSDHGNDRKDETPMRIHANAFRM